MQLSNEKPRQLIKFVEVQSAIIQEMSEIWTPEIRTCLKSELLNFELVWNPNFCEFRFQTPHVSKNQTLDLDFRHFTKLSEIWTRKFGFQTHFEKSVWKLNSYWVSEIRTSSDFRQSLKFFLITKICYISDAFLLTIL